MKKVKKYLDLNEQTYRLIRGEITDRIVTLTKESQAKIQERDEILPELEKLKNEAIRLQEQIRIVSQEIVSNTQEIKSSKKFSDKLKKGYSSSNEYYIDAAQKSIRNKNPKKLNNYVLLTEENFRLTEDSLTDLIIEKTEQNKANVIKRNLFKEKLLDFRRMIAELEEVLAKIDRLINSNNKSIKNYQKFDDELTYGYSSDKDYIVDRANQKVQLKRKKR